MRRLIVACHAVAVATLQRRDGRAIDRKQSSRHKERERHAAARATPHKEQKKQDIYIYIYACMYVCMCTQSNARMTRGI